MTSIIATSILVSLDAFFIGISLGVQKGFKAIYFLLILAIIFIASAITFFLAVSFMEYATFELGWIIGSAFLILALKNLFSKDEKQDVLKNEYIVALGLSMSIDAIIATAALTIEQPESFIIPVVVSGGHLLCIFLGGFVAKHIKTTHRTHNIISASCLFLVSLFNFIGVF